MSSASLYFCDWCPRTFHNEKNLRFHYFCSTRTEEERSLDFGALFSLIPKISQKSDIENSIITPRIIYRHLPNMDKFKEWVEEIKDLLIYKECDKAIKRLQILSLLDGLFKIQHQDSYVFNEGLFLLPELDNDRESFIWAFQQMLETCGKTDSLIKNSQRLFLKLTGLNFYSQWIKEDLMDQEAEDYDGHLSLDNDSIRLGALLGELTTLTRVPVIAQHPNPQDPERYHKLTLEVEPFEITETPPLQESETLPPEF